MEIVDKRENTKCTDLKITQVPVPVAKRFRDACLRADTHPWVVLMEFIEQYSDSRGVNADTTERAVAFWLFAERRRSELWDEMYDHIDEHAPPTGPNSSEEQVLRLEQKIEWIVEDEWQSILKS